MLETGFPLILGAPAGMIPRCSSPHLRAPLLRGDALTALVLPAFELNGEFLSAMAVEQHA
ncbi:hypothetical protein [Rhodococcus oryzae]|uniref:hypothetical protein n=1 Tax=Rhodococcus oryzae TaxID=2571143 RepID=UPI0037AC30C5